MQDASCNRVGSVSNSDVPRLLGVPFALCVSLIYLVIGSLWIFFSDRLMVLISRNPRQLLFLSTGKGWLYVLLTAFLLYACLDRFTRQIRRNQQRMRADAERHRTTLQAIGDAVLSTDADGRVAMMNPIAESLTGWTAEAACGRPVEEIFQIISEDTREPVRRIFERIGGAGTISDPGNHILLVARDGTERPIADSAAPIRDTNGNVDGVVLVFRDQSAAREADAALRESELALRRAQRLAHIGSWTFDLNNGTVYASDEARRIYGLTGDSWRIEEVQKVPLVTYRDMLDKALAGLIRDGKPYDLEYQIRRTSDGAVRYIHSIAEYDSDRKRVIGTIRDITDRKRGDHERERLQAQLMQARKIESVGRLAGGVAHDFNNMLGVIMGYAEMAMNKIGPQDALRGDLNEIMNAARRSADMTSQLLAFARKQPIMPHVLDLNKTVGGILNMLRRLIGAHIDLAWNPVANVWPVRMDRSQIEQIMTNLCLNARDAISGAGRIVIETDMVILTQVDCAGQPGLAPGCYVKMTVTDNGCGMDKQLLDTVFEPFFTTKDIGKGTGLGLATVYGTVKQHHGYIHVSSTPGEGTRFNIFLPRCDGAPEADPPGLQDTPSTCAETIHDAYARHQS